MLHDVVPRMAEQLVDFLSPLDFPVPEQVIEVPTIVCPPRADALLHLDTPIPEYAVFEVHEISCPSRFIRSVLREPQKAEQLVEVPTLVSLVEVFEQPVDIPVRAWGGTGGRLQDFLPGQVFLLVCGADRRHSSSSSWFLWRFSRFSPRTEFNSEFGTDP